MSRCYDFEKWTMITLASVAISLTIGLISFAYGYIDPEPYGRFGNFDDAKIYSLIPKFNELEQLVNYCYEHATDSPNPIQDLINQGLISSEYSDCKTVKSAFDSLDAQLAALIHERASKTGIGPGGTDCPEGYKLDEEGVCIQSDYLNCLRNQTKTDEEKCDYLLEE